MRKFLEYFSGVLYSVKECMKTWKMPKKYPIIVFIISFFMLLSPIQFNMYSTPNESLINQIPHINDVLKDVAIDLNNQGINVEIKDNKIHTSKPYNKVIDGYTIYIGVELEDYEEVIVDKPQVSDNIIYFGLENFYARYVDRTDLGIKKGESTLAGTYNKSNSFTFNSLYEVKDDDAQVYNLVGSLLKTIYLTNSGYNTILWVFIIEMINLFYMLLGGFVLLFANKKGNRDYKLTYGQCFLTLMGSVIFPSMLASIIGMINFSYFTISYIILALIRLFMICYSQISSNKKYNQIEIEEDENKFELNFK